MEQLDKWEFEENLTLPGIIKMRSDNGNLSCGFVCGDTPLNWNLNIRGNIMDFKVLAVGDVVGNPGMERIRKSLRKLKMQTSHIA